MIYSVPAIAFPALREKGLASGLLIIQALNPPETEGRGYAGTYGSNPFSWYFKWLQGYRGTGVVS